MTREELNVWREHQERLYAMAVDKGDTWDLSDNDQAACNAGGDAIMALLEAALAALPSEPPALVAPTLLAALKAIVAVADRQTVEFDAARAEAQSPAPSSVLQILTDRASGILDTTNDRYRVGRADGILEAVEAVERSQAPAPDAGDVPPLPTAKEELAWLIERDIAGVLHYWTGRVIDGREVGAWSKQRVLGAIKGEAGDTP